MNAHQRRHIIQQHLLIHLLPHLSSSHKQRKHIPPSPLTLHQLLLIQYIPCQTPYDPLDDALFQESRYRKLDDPGEGLDDDGREGTDGREAEVDVLLPGSGDGARFC